MKISWSISQLSTDCDAALSFIAKEKGIVATAKDIIPSGARIPVKTRTAASGKKNMPNGISRQSRPAINAFVFQGIFALSVRVFDVTI
jgi:hypothetical protein